MRIRQSKNRFIISLWCISIVLLVATIILAFLIKATSVKQDHVLRIQQSTLTFTNLMIETSTEMTMLTREFANNADANALNDFWETYSNLQIETSNQLSLINKRLTAEEHEWLSTVLQDQDELNETNMKVFILILKAYSTPSALLPDSFKFYRLLKQQENLSPIKKIETARNLSYLKSYMNDRHAVMNGLQKINASINHRSKNELTNTRNTINNYILLITIICAINLLVIISIVWIRALED